MDRTSRPATVAAYTVVLLGCVFAIFPYLLTALTAFKGPGQLHQTLPWEPAFPPSVSSFDRLFASGFGIYLANTVVITACIVAGQVLFSVLAAYAFARLQFVGRDLLFWVYLATLMVPAVVTMIPLYLIMQKLQLIDTWAGLLLPTILGSPYLIFLLRQFFRTIPQDLEDAARIDGASRLRILVSIFLPLCRPAVITATTLSAVGAWNAFLWPLIITSSDRKRLLSVGLALFKGEVGVDYNAIMAGSLVALAPLLVLFIFFQRFIIRSVAVTGLK